jgi:hypothetical protein
VTVATLDDLLSGPKPKAHKDLVRYGYREDTIKGRKHYVGRDENSRAVVGPVRHRAKGLLNKGLRKKKIAELPTPERTMNITIDHEAVRKAGLAMQQHMQQMQESLQTVDFSKLGTASPTPPTPQEPSRWQRVKDAVATRYHDDEWHKASRNTAATILMWSFTAASVITLGKGVLWVLSV